MKSIFYISILLVITAIDVMAQCPSLFTLTGGGTVCSGTTVSLTLSSSEAGVNYQLKSGGSTDVGSAVAGTGGALTWSNTLTATATYTIVATHSTSACSQTMTGSAAFTVMSLPSATINNTSGGTVLTCYVSPLAFTGSSTTTGASFSWTGPGGFTSNTAQILVTSPGTYTLTVTATSGCMTTRARTVTQTLVPPTATATVSSSIQCANQSVTLQASPTLSYVSYSWTGPGNFTSSIQNPSVNVPGVYNLTVTTPGNCTGNASVMVSSAADISLPNLFTVNGGGTICSNAFGSISVNGSQTGINYQLQLNGVNYGASISGTGSLLSWNNLNAAGNYTVVGVNATSGCSQPMNGSGIVTLLSSPAAFTMGGGGVVHQNQALPITLSGSEMGVNYQLKAGTRNIGTALVGTGGALTLANKTTPGIYTVLATNATGCTQTMVGSIEIKNPVQVMLDDLSFQYRYDSRHRKTHEKVPGAAVVYMVYDNRDRLVLTQDGNQRTDASGNITKREWKFIKYDAFNRPVSTGIYTHSTVADQAAMQVFVNAYYATLSTDQAWYESYVGTRAGNVLGYDNKSFPQLTSQTDYLSVTYYDQYDAAIAPAGYGYITETPALTDQETSNNSNVIGQITGTLVKNLDDGTWLRTVNYYDGKYRPIQNISDHPRGKIITTNVVDFVGKVLTSKRTLQEGAVSNTVKETYSYDHANRLNWVKHSVNRMADVVILKNNYNELGQLINKRLHSTDTNATDSKQSVDYRYNIRGWLTRINNADLTPDNTNDPKDLFGINLLYNEQDAGLGNTPTFNGTISALKWSNNLGAFDVKERAYKYSYDPLNRLTISTHLEKTIGWNTATSYHEDNITYDLNGNIKTLNRTGVNGTDLDKLVYDYGSRGNQVQSITDNADKTKGFKENNTTGIDYTYDANGSQLTDKNKGITRIIYNHLNQPDTIVVTNGDYIKFAYDAHGNRLSKSLYTSASLLKKKTDYVGEFIYENDSLKFIRHKEGRVMMTPAQLGEYQYELRDNKDNVRMMFTTKPGQEQGKATLETINYAAEQNKFLRYENARRINTILFDHTRTGSTNYSQRLNGTANERIGLARSLSVMPGDTVKMDVYVKYLDTNSSNWTTVLTNLISSVAGGTAPAGTVVDGSGYSTNGSIPFPYGGLLNKTSTTGNGPKAYLNYLVFDRDYKFTNGGYVRMSDVAKENGSNVPHEKLSVVVPINEAGFVYLYLSNENETPVEVYFDDWNVTQIKSPIIQANTFYPFGMDIASLGYQRENIKKNNYLYNGRSELQDDFGLNFYLTHYRIQETDAPRWWQIDPKVEAFYGWSPYNYAFNSPVVNNDPNGDCPWCIGALIGAATDYAAQVAVNLSEGKDLGDAMTDVSLTSIATSAALGAVTSGVSAMTRTIGVQVEKQVAKTVTQKVVQQTTKVVTVTATKVRNKLDQAAAARGRANEKKTLAEEKLPKNNKTMTATDPKTGKEVKTIPDGMRGGQTVEVKDVKQLSDSKQLRAQSEISSQSGERATVITGTKTEVSSTVERRMNVERRDHLGPQ